MTAALVTTQGDFGEEHMRIVRDAYAPTASKAEFEVLWLGARARGLDPVLRQIYFIKRTESRDGLKVDIWTTQVSIDGLRSIAQRTGVYDGQDEPTFELDEAGGVLSVRVAVYRKDISRPFVGVARWSEFAQLKSNGDTTHMWGKMPFHMLCKCAEALALRKAFPEQLGGLYTTDEMPEPDAEPQRPRHVTLTERAPLLTSTAESHAEEARSRDDTAFALAEAKDLLDVLALARDSGAGAEAEQAFAARIAVLARCPHNASQEAIGKLAQDYPGLVKLARASGIAADSAHGKTIARALSLAKAKISEAD